MATNDYIPDTDDGFRTYAENFAGNISANPAKFMLTPAEAASIQAVVDDYVAKLAIATNEATRTKPTIADKDDARSIAETLIRQYAIDIKFNEGILDSDKLAIGVRPVNPDREPIDPPSTSPLLNILGNTPGEQTLRFSDSTTPDSRAKPFGSAALHVYRAIGETEDMPFSEASFLGAFTRNPIVVSFTETENKKIAKYWGCWANAKGETGPFSLPIAMTIAA